MKTKQYNKKKYHEIKQPRGELFKKDAIAYLIKIKVLRKKDNYGKREKMMIRRVMQYGKLLKSELEYNTIRRN